MFIAENRKRKQQEDKLFSSSLPTTTSWSDFIYSSPSSPSVEHENHHLSFDSLFEQHALHFDHTGTNSRRHSVAVGEMDYHSFDFAKHEPTLPAQGDANLWDDLQRLLASSSTPLCLPHQQHPERPIHRRTMSLREDDPHYATLLSPTLSTTSTSTFFSSSFLDALVAENGHDRKNSSDLSFLEPSTDSFDQTVTPSAITNEIHTMADWLLEQQEVKEMHTQAQKRQRRSTTSLSPASPTMGSSLSSLSPSPPITPMQPTSLGFEPISFQPQPTVQQDWDLSLLDTKEVESNPLKPMIREYLLCREHQDRATPVAGERTVMVLTSRVAQKSYGTEKRFLCPPPTTILKGAHWWTHGSENKKHPHSLTEPTKSNLFQSQSMVLSPPKLTIHISGETINQTGVIEWQSSSAGTSVDPTTVTSSNAGSIFGRCVSKQLYINDADEKRKRVEVLAKLQLGNGQSLGTFPSKGIKVISKPSKKRQSIKNMELCIHHGTTISLFNRIRSQTVSTKYLGVSNGGNNGGTCFVARTGSWDPFVIWIVDTSRSPDTMPRPHQHHPHNPNFPPPPAIALQTPHTTQQPIAILYNQPVVLQCVTTGLVSPVMVIRKVDKGSMVLGGNRLDDFSGKTGGECGDETLGDPVSQLHKVAFQIVQDPTFAQHNKANGYTTKPTYEMPQSCHPVTYLACLNDVVGMHKTNYNRHLLESCQSDWEEKVETKGRRGSLADRRGSASDSSGLEGACWTEDVSDAAVWTIVGTDCANYTFWTPLHQTTEAITPFPVVHELLTKKKDQLTLVGDHLTEDVSVWFGDIKASSAEFHRDSIVCPIPDVQELQKSPTCLVEEDGLKKKIPLLLVRGDGIVYRTDRYYTF
ncbi:hypothetical protein EDC96DRAFT_519924 [Choanephora cucurbitarum]|nr:hypothetical protein EDC96DRAFT_519924 [Choanephora cucurbitarum]